MTCRRLYIIGLFYPAMIAITSTGILAIFDNSEYNSEWLTKESVVFMAILAAVVYSLIICVLGLPIFLNSNILQTKGTASFLSWFLLPMTFMIVAIFKTTYHRLKYEIDTEWQLLYLITLNLPFVVGLTWTYTIFLKTDKKDIGKSIK